MTMGEIIKQYREKLDLSQEALGSKLGVNKAAVQKWESGKVENLKRSTIKKLAEMFNITPCELMCFEEDHVSDEQLTQADIKYNINNQLAKEVSLIEQIQNQYGKDAVKLLECFTQLNIVGQEKALENVSDLAALDKYTQKEKTELRNA